MHFHIDGEILPDMAETIFLTQTMALKQAYDLFMENQKRAAAR
jgi:hypothetical protein